MMIVLQQKQQKYGHYHLPKSYKTVLLVGLLVLGLVLQQQLSNTFVVLVVAFVHHSQHHQRLPSHVVVPKIKQIPFIPRQRQRQRHNTDYTQSSLFQLLSTKQEEIEKKKVIRRSIDRNLLLVNKDDSTSTVTATATRTSTAGQGQEQKQQQQEEIPNFAKFVNEQTNNKNNNNIVNRNECTIMQINIGLLCNQACSHCHVDSSPARTVEQMSTTDVLQCIQLLQNTPSITTIDITGGAPEMNVNFRLLISSIRHIRPAIQIIDRCNLTILLEDNQKDLILFLKENNVHIIASLPCYDESNVNEQRGANVFEKSIHALQLLNQVGYGTATSTDTDSNSNSNSQLQLDLVYNPNGAFLPPNQSKLQEQYKEQLYNKYNIQFNNLLTITNMPIKKFADYLIKENLFYDYMSLLVNNFNINTITNVMCLNTISISWDGYIYDCDFNQQLNYNLMKQQKTTTTTDITSTSTSTSTVDIETKVVNNNRNNNNNNFVSIYDITNLNELQRYKIRTDRHCFGCTAGSGSSCQGATA